MIIFNEISFKVDTIYSLASILNSRNLEQNSQILFNLSKSQDSFVSMGKTNFINILKQIIYDEWTELYEWFDYYRHSISDQSSLCYTASNAQLFEIFTRRANARLQACQALQNFLQINPTCSNISSSESTTFDISQNILFESNQTHLNEKNKILLSVIAINEYNQKFYNSIIDFISSTSNNNETSSILSGLTDMESIYKLRECVCDISKRSFNEQQRFILIDYGVFEAILELIEIFWNFIMYINQNDKKNFIDLSIPMNEYNEVLCFITLESIVTLSNLTFFNRISKNIFFSRKFSLISVFNCLNYSYLYLSSINDSNCENNCNSNNNRTLINDLVKIISCLIRNVALNSPIQIIQIINEQNFVSLLTKCALIHQRLNKFTLKSILSTLVNLSNFSMENKEKICSVNQSIKVFTDLMSSKVIYDEAVEELSITLLRSLAVYCAMHEKARNELRECNFYKTLIEYSLVSSNLNIVANACGVLWILSARCEQDQQIMWEFGAENRLKALTYSMHKSISMASCAALKNLYSISNNIATSGLYSGSINKIASSMSSLCLQNDNSDGSLNLSHSSSFFTHLSNSLTASCSSSTSSASGSSVGSILSHRSRKQMLEDSDDFLKKLEKIQIVWKIILKMS